MSTSMTPASGLSVFYVEPVGGHRGMHYYDLELCLALQSAGVDVTLMTCDETKNVDIPPSLRAEFPFQGIYGNATKAVRGLRYLRGLVKIGWAMERRGVLLAHFHYLHFLPLDYLYLRWLSLINKHVVITAHDVIPFDSKASDLTWLQRLYHVADQVIVHAESNRDTIVGTFEISPDKVSVIPMGPYPGFAKKRKLPTSTAKQRLGLETNVPVVLFFGQIKKVKGLQYLIRAFRQVLGRRLTARLVIAGPEWKESFSVYAALIQELGLTDQVLTRIEYVPDDEVGIYYSAADVVVLPYTEAYQSGVLYMAYSFGKPVVTSAIGGLAEVVEDGATGFLVPPGDPEALAEAISRTLDDPQRAQAMGARGRALVEEQYSWTRIATLTRQVYGEVLKCN